MKVDLKAHNGFDLGYAGRIASNTDHELEESYIHHTTANAMDDAPLLYEKTAKPVHVFYDENQAENLSELATQLLGRRHNLLEGFSAISTLNGDNDNFEAQDEVEQDNEQSHENRVG